MNLITLSERERYLAAFNKEMKGKRLKSSEIVLCPPYVHLESFIKNIKNKAISFGAQDAFWESKGSYTGEISSLMAKNIGANFVIIGHSERRKYFGETNEIINLKIIAAIKSGITPIFCLGETKEEKETDLTMDVVVRQIKEGLAGISKTLIEKIVFAYEPVWAVGSDIVPSANEIMGARLLIKKIINDKYGARYAEKLKIIYGGSVKSSLVEQVCVSPGMDGVLVGRESLVPHEFIKIAEIIDSN